VSSSSGEGSSSGDRHRNRDKSSQLRSVRVGEEECRLWVAVVLWGALVLRRSCTRGALGKQLQQFLTMCHKLQHS
jgi:hypothetical protein